jgi:hypothetical protein
VIFELQNWALKNVDFKYSKNTTNWEKEIGENKKEIIIQKKKKEYKIFRKKKFNF